MIVSGYFTATSPSLGTRAADTSAYNKPIQYSKLTYE